MTKGQSLLASAVACMLLLACASEPPRGTLTIDNSSETSIAIDRPPDRTKALLQVHYSCVGLGLDTADIAMVDTVLLFDGELESGGQRARFVELAPGKHTLWLIQERGIMYPNDGDALVTLDAVSDHLYAPGMGYYGGMYGGMDHGWIVDCGPLSIGSCPCGPDDLPVAAGHRP